jgi:hypothetical protein
MHKLIIRNQQQHHRLCFLRLHLHYLILPLLLSLKLEEQYIFMMMNHKWILLLHSHNQMSIQYQLLLWNNNLIQEDSYNILGTL